MRYTVTVVLGYHQFPDSRLYSLLVIKGGRSDSATLREAGVLILNDVTILHF